MNPKMLSGVLDLVVRVSGEQAASRFGVILSSLRGKFFDLGTTIIWLDRLTLALGRTWEALGEAIGATRVGEQARDFYNFAQMLGLGVEEFQAFALVAGQFDAKIRDVVDAFMQMEERTQAFIRGDKTIVATMKGSGLSQLDLKGKDTLETFKTLATAINKLPTSQRLTALQSFFGEEGSRQLGPLSTAGVDVIVARMQEARDLGAVMSEEQIAAARHYNFAMNRVQMVITAIGNNFARIFMPALEHIGAWIVKIGKRFSTYFSRNGETFANQVVRLVDFVLAKLDHLVAWIDQNVMPFEDFVTRLVQGVGLLSAGLLGLFNATLVSNILASAKAMFVLATFTEDYLGKLKGEKNLGDTLAGDSPWYQQLAGDLKGIAGLVQYVAGAIGALFSTIAQSTTGFILLRLTLLSIGGALAALAVFVKLLTGFFLVLDAVVQALVGVVSIFVGLLAYLFGNQKLGESLVGVGESFMIGAGQALVNTTKVMDMSSAAGPDFGGYVSRAAAAETLGPTAFNTMYGKNGYSNRPTTVIQNINATVNTSGEAQTYAEFDKIMAAAMKAKAEGGAP